MTSMTGKVAFVTGGGSGIGNAVARRFAQLGATVGIAGRRLSVLEETAKEIEAIPLQCDVSDMMSVKDAVNELVGHSGRLDVVVNNAAIAVQGSVDELTDEDWASAVDINLNGVFRVARETLPYLRQSGGGAIVNVSSIGGLFAAPSGAAYSTTKAALLGLTRSMARDHGADNIRVNTVCPGWVDTAMADPAVKLLMQAHGLSRTEASKRLVEHNPIQRIAAPDEIARCIEFLSTDASSCVTGTVLMADNGQSIVDVGFIPIQDALLSLNK